MLSHICIQLENYLSCWLATKYIYSMISNNAIFTCKTSLHSKSRTFCNWRLPRISCCYWNSKANFVVCHEAALPGTLCAYPIVQNTCYKTCLWVQTVCSKVNRTKRIMESPYVPLSMSLCVYVCVCVRVRTYASVSQLIKDYGFLLQIILNYLQSQSITCLEKIHCIIVQNYILIII